MSLFLSKEKMKMEQKHLTSQFNKWNYVIQIIEKKKLKSKNIQKTKKQINLTK